MKQIMGMLIGSERGVLPVFRIVPLAVLAAVALGIVIYPAARGSYYAVKMDRAVGAGDEQAVAQLLGQGTDVNRGTKGGTPLISAVRNGRPGIVRLLIAHRADINRKDGAGRTALSYARQAQQVEITALLLAAGARE